MSALHEELQSSRTLWLFPKGCMSSITTGYFRLCSDVVLAAVSFRRAMPQIAPSLSCSFHLSDAGHSRVLAQAGAASSLMVPCTRSFAAVPHRFADASQFSDCC